MTTKITNTLSQMMEDRGYEPMDENDYTSGRVFMSRTDETMTFVRIVRKDGKKVLGTEDIHSILQTLMDIGATNGIIIGHGASPHANELIRTNNSSSSESYLELFLLNRLVSNPTRTVLYNPHTLVTGSDLAEVRRVFTNNGDTTLQNLPKILATEDPVIKYFGWRAGDVVKITRIPKQIREYRPRNTSQIVYKLVI